ncbi:MULTISPECIES: CPCC family cysteine-rich protein [unclassified Pedobacter]|uniref:CPCC family cysteine-rich protein n=1 Tax=unclassified Pedobacter TaxID=2628915 RepID=UPI001DED3B3A|nr:MULTISPECIES: CPCC family cysteine-rich protein [unclassified Pedobacter]CAH0168475.1 hypothetical protein SRABI126_00968 [Pedobacter sp. Bi126]CAH0286705.1 hypothetical protein SRABI36_04180 [Pedobacter sp. Bi36]
MDIENKIKCVCCGFFTIEKDAISTICPVCFWHKDFYQEEHIDDDGGPNSISLRGAKVNFKSFGVIEREFLDFVRPPKEDEIEG